MSPVEIYKYIKLDNYNHHITLKSENFVTNTEIKHFYS